MEANILALMAQVFKKDVEKDQALLAINQLISDISLLGRFFCQSNALEERAFAKFLRLQQTFHQIGG